MPVSSHTYEKNPKKIHMLLKSRGHKPNPWPSYSSQDHREALKKGFLGRQISSIEPCHLARPRRCSPVQVADLPSISPRCNTQRATFDRGNQSSCFLQSVRILAEAHHCSRGRWRIAAAEDDEDVLGPEDSVVAHEEQFSVGRWLSRRSCSCAWPSL